MTRIAASDAPLVHVWTGPEDFPLILPARRTAAMVAGAPMPPEEIRKRSEGWSARDLESPGWRILSTKAAVVRGDVPEEALKTASAYAEELGSLLRGTLGGGEPRAPLSFRIFADPRRFRRTAMVIGAPNAESYYDPRSGEAAFWFDAYASPDLFQRGFAHEFTHAYMDLVWATTGPLWFAEGMAEYFSNLDWREGAFRVGEVNPAAAALLAVEPPRSLADLLRVGRADIYGERFPYLYAQSWSFVHFLFSRFPELIGGLLRKGEGAVDAAALEGAWLAHVKELSR